MGRPLAEILDGCHPRSGATQDSAFQSYREFREEFDALGLVAAQAYDVQERIAAEVDELERCLGMYFYDEVPQQANEEALDYAIAKLQTTLEQDIAAPQ